MKTVHAKIVKCARIKGGGCNNKQNRLRSGDGRDSYSTGAQFESRPKHRLRVFVIFVSTSRQIPEEHLDQAATTSLQILFSYLLSNHLTVFGLANERVVKCHKNKYIK
jgi:hypothetical protein